MVSGNQIVRGITVIGRDVKKVMQRQARFYRATPVVATLFLTYRCNSHCKTCTLWNRSVEEEKKREIGFPEWKLIIDKLADAGMRIAEIFGGNVLLRKELLIEVLQYLHEKKFCIHMPTNQIGLDDEAAKAVAAYANYVYISTDGVGEYQDAIRGQQGAFRRSEDAISKLLKMRENGRPRLICNTTVSKFNTEILESMVEYAEVRGFDEIHFEYVGEFTQEQVDASLIDGLRPTPYYLKQEESVLVDQQGARRLKETLKEIKKKYSGRKIGIVTINIDILSEDNLYRGTVPHDKCYVERMEATVDPAGNLIICPFINNYVVGNLLKSSFQETWDNAVQKKFRSYQNRGAVGMCQHCILGVQRNPGVLTSLRRIYLNRVEPKLPELFGIRKN